MDKNVLYHYCSMETFKKIMQNYTIRVSDCSKTNDYSETQWIVTSFKNKIIDAIMDDDEFCEIYNFNNNLREIITIRVNTVIDAVYIKNSRYMFTFVSCFSEEADLLSQWRGYADDGQGLSIGFNKDILMTIDTGGYNHHFKKVIYHEKNQIDFIVGQISDLIYGYKQIGDSDDVHKCLNDFLMDISLRIATVRNDSPTFKNKAFSEEKEWRLIINNHLSNYNSDYNNDSNTIGTIDENYSVTANYTNGFSRSPLQFMSTSNNLISFFDLNFEKIKENLIKEIYIGPKCNVSELDMKLFLESYGYKSEEIKIINSIATYR